MTYTCEREFLEGLSGPRMRFRPRVSLSWDENENGVPVPHVFSMKYRYTCRGIRPQVRRISLFALCQKGYISSLCVLMATSQAFKLGPRRDDDDDDDDDEVNVHMPCAYSTLVTLCPCLYVLQNIGALQGTQVAPSGVFTRVMLA